jgi:hypothetical protein
MLFPESGSEIRLLASAAMGLCGLMGRRLFLGLTGKQDD